jgi:septal ring factor EnvC (AmiA/AmiB activator)
MRKNTSRRWQERICDEWVWRLFRVVCFYLFFCVDCLNQVKRASSAAQVAAMRSNLEQQEDNLALQRRQLEALETQLKEEEEKEDIPQQYPDAKEHGDRGMS